MIPNNYKRFFQAILFGIITVLIGLIMSYVFDFLAQLWSNAFWLKLPTTVDDYVGMVLILFGMYAAKFKLFN